MEKKGYTLEDKIRSNSIETLGNALLVTVSVIAVGYGIYGTVRITKDLIDSYQAGCNFNINRDNDELYGAIYSSMIFFGFTGFCSRREALKNNLECRKNLIKRLDDQKISDEENR